MMTIEKLVDFGADVKEGLGRCMNNEGFYLTLVNMIRDEKNFGLLQEAIDAHDYDHAFEYAHSLKGVLGNLSLTPLYEPMVEITELLRAREEADYPELLKDFFEKKAEFDALFE